MSRNDAQSHQPPRNLAGAINTQSHSNIKKSSNLRGRLIGDTWHCDCDPRLPAVHFQTKNGGRNHGRWFYTCQKPQIKRCGFFLWDDDAKMRTTMNGGTRATNGSETTNSNTHEHDPQSGPKTPTSRRTVDSLRSETGLLTPDTGRKRRWRSEEDETDLASASLTKARRTQGPGNQDENETFGSHNGNSWEDIQGNLGLGTPVKQEKIPEEGLHDRTPTGQSAPQEHTASYPRTPSSINAGDHASYPPSAAREIYPPTPTPSRFHSAPLGPTIPQPDSATTSSTSFSNCTLTTQAFALLGAYDVDFPAHVRDALTELLNRYDLQTKGIARGRDISRLAVQKKDKKIQELVGRIDALEAEKEAWRASRVKEEPD